MKTKLSPLQELRLERSRLKNECTEYEDKLQGNWHYAKGNFGRLAIGTVLSSAKNGIGDLFSLVTGKKHNSEESDEEDKSASSSVVTQMLLGAAPFVWEMVQPMIVGMIMKKVKSLFGDGEKKKKKQIKKKKKASDLD